MTVNLGGRPRIHDRDQIALEMVEWAAQDTSINLNKFCCTRKPTIAPSIITTWAKEDDKFRIAYETAKGFLACRREEWLSHEQLHVKAYDLNATNYDHFLRDEKKGLLAYEASLKKEESKDPQKITFEVNYGNGNQVEILSKDIPASDPKSP